MPRKLIIALLILGGGGLLLMTSACQAPEVGLVEGRLRPAPDSPNCVHSEATDESHRIAPLAFEGPLEPAWERIQNIIQELPRSTVVTVTDRYLHAEFRSLVFRFVDDLELLAEPEKQRIQVRSAARTGHYDFGVNRRRVETIRESFERP